MGKKYKVLLLSKGSITKLLLLEVGGGIGKINVDELDIQLIVIKYMMKIIIVELVILL